jgi:hypothetical protein
MRELYMKYPVLLLYWAVSKKWELDKWARSIRKTYKSSLEPPLLDAVLLIEKYTTNK